MNFTADTADATPEPLPRAPWYHHAVRQPNVRRFGPAWVDTSMAQCYANASDVGRPALVVREAHVITNGSRRAALYMPPGVAPSDEQCLLVAAAAGIPTDAAAPFPQLDVSDRPDEKLAAVRPSAWLSDTIVAYRGWFRPECGHTADTFFQPRSTFPRCDVCGRFVRWCRLHPEDLAPPC